MITGGMLRSEYMLCTNRAFLITWFYCRVICGVMLQCYFMMKIIISQNIAQYICFEDKLTEQTQNLYDCTLYTCTCMQLGRSMHILVVAWVVMESVHYFRGLVHSALWPEALTECVNTRLCELGHQRDFQGFCARPIYLLHLIREDLL